jgi:hypothetical protein
MDVIAYRKIPFSNVNITTSVLSCKIPALMIGHQQGSQTASSQQPITVVVRLYRL